MVNLKISIYAKNRLFNFNPQMNRDLLTIENTNDFLLVICDDEREQLERSRFSIIPVDMISDIFSKNIQDHCGDKLLNIDSPIVIDSIGKINRPISIHSITDSYEKGIREKLSYILLKEKFVYNGQKIEYYYIINLENFDKYRSDMNL